MLDCLGMSCLLFCFYLFGCCVYRYYLFKKYILDEKNWNHCEAIITDRWGINDISRSQVKEAMSNSQTYAQVDNFDILVSKDDDEKNSKEKLSDDEYDSSSSSSIDVDNAPLYAVEQYYSYQVALPFLEISMNKKRKNNCTFNSSINCNCEYQYLEERQILICIKDVVIDSYSECEHDSRYFFVPDRFQPKFYNNSLYKYFCNLRINDKLGIDYCVNPFYFESINRLNSILKLLTIFGIKYNIDQLLWNYIGTMNDYTSLDYNKDGYCDYHDHIDCHGNDINLETWTHYFLRCIINIMPINFHGLTIGQYFIRVSKVKHLNYKHSLLIFNMLSIVGCVIFYGTVIMLFIALLIFHNYQELYHPFYNLIVKQSSLIYCSIAFFLFYNYLDGLKWSIFFAKHYAFIPTRDVFAPRVKNGASAHVKQAN